MLAKNESRQQLLTVYKPLLDSRDGETELCIRRWLKGGYGDKLLTEIEVCASIARVERRMLSYGLENPMSEKIKEIVPSESEQAALALISKGVTLWQQGNAGEAIAVYDEIERRFGRDTAPGVREQVAKALFNKGVTLRQQKKTEEAIAVYDDIVRRFGKNTSPGVRKQVAKALNNKGFALLQQGKVEEAVAVYDAVERRFGKDASPDVREQVARAFVNKVSVECRFA